LPNAARYLRVKRRRCRPVEAMLDAAATRARGPGGAMKKVITYGTFDLLHVGHIRLLERLKQLGDYLVVAVSSDEFNAEKGKRSVYSYEDRAQIVSAIRYVDEVIPENSWDQKRTDVVQHGISVFAIGEDWRGRFDHLSDLCEVVYLERTEGISTTEIKSALSRISPKTIDDLKTALDIINGVLSGIR
jgi:glycerol-3-phosphate cytidylyltransferase